NAGSCIAKYKRLRITAGSSSTEVGMGLVIASVMLSGFVLNVTLGSINGQAPLGNVAEMILLFCASIAFVADILRLEAKAKSGVSGNQ
ncbi:MAG: hypothetical protein OXE82_03860, partial [Rhodobacter sp.]|nr:hypothetical protein [Rhodobacter sp.]